MDKTRITAFSDGVFAIAITLLILEVKVPNVPASQLNAAVIDLWPKLLAYILSFIIIGSYWVAHHSMFHYYKQVDRNALWINNFHLLVVAFLPFPTSLLGGYPFHPLPILLYGITLCLINGLSTLLWLYATVGNRLAVKEVTAHFSSHIAVMHASPILFYVLAILIGYYKPLVSYCIFMTVPLFFILPNPILAKYLIPGKLETV